MSTKLNTNEKSLISVLGLTYAIITVFFSKEIFFLLSFDRSIQLVLALTGTINLGFLITMRRFVFLRAASQIALISLLFLFLVNGILRIFPAEVSYDVPFNIYIGVVFLGASLSLLWIATETTRQFLILGISILFGSALVAYPIHVFLQAA